MKSPYVCTKQATHRRIVSSNPKALGATTSSSNSVLSFASPRGRGQGEGEPNLPIKNHHESPVYRCLSGIIGFEISFRLSRAKPFSSPRGRGYSAGAARTEGELSRASCTPKIAVASQHLYKIYKFTQNHTVTLQLCTAVKLLLSNRSASRNQPKTQILSPPPCTKTYPSRSQRQGEGFARYRIRDGPSGSTHKH
jgi:hypothetical protein